MKHIHFIALTIVFAIILCIFLVNRKTPTASLNNSDETALLQQTILQQSAAFNQLYLIDDSAKTPEGVSVALKDVFRNNKLVLRYTGENCDECVDTELRALKDLGQVIGDTNIVILASYERQRDFKIMCQTFKIGFPAFNISAATIVSPMENANQPYYFVVDHNMNTTNLFIPNKELPDISASYYRMIGKLWGMPAQTGSITSADIETTSLHINHYAHRFGVLQFGEEAVATFTLTNTGTVPLLLQKVEATCGCTVPEWSRQPVSPGQTAIVKLKYDTRLKGIFAKKAFIFSNARDSPHGISISGEVIEKNDE